jgi:hypothetical protein
VDAEHFVGWARPVADHAVEPMVELVYGQYALVERRRIHPQPVLGVRKHTAHHLLSGLVDPMHG